MDDFEYSVEICDRDWDCFLAECNECDMLPPSLARVDDSGMSDIDDTGSILAKRARRVDLTAGLSETDRPIDGPPDCEGSPVEHYLSKHGVGGMENVLSGSEEDIHLQSVNIFFERLKGLTEAEPSQVRAGKNREATQGEERCSDGQQASGSTVPKNISELNSLPARGETAVGKVTMRSVNTTRNINTMRKVEAESSVSPEPAVSNSMLKANKSSETDVFITEESCIETRVNEITPLDQAHVSPDRVICSETTPHTYNVRVCTPLDDTKQEGLLVSQLTLGQKRGPDLTSNLEIMRNVKWRGDQTPVVSQSDTASTSKAVSQESSPSASIKRKRRKKRRLSVEPGEAGLRQVSGKQSDSEEEQYAFKGAAGLCLSEDVRSFYLNEPQQNLTSVFTPYSTTSNFPVNAFAMEIKVNLSHAVPPCNNQYQRWPESVVRERSCAATGLAENNSTNNRLATPQTYAPNSSANVATCLQPCSKFQEEESAGLTESFGLPVSAVDGATCKSDNEQNVKCCSAEVKSVSHLANTESNAPAVEVSQNDKLSAAKSVLAAKAGNSGSDEHALCQSGAEPQQQLEIDRHNTGQYSTALEEPDFFLSATGGITSHTLNIKPQLFETRAHPFPVEISNKMVCTNLTSDCINPSADKSCLSKGLSSFDINDTALQTEYPLEVQTFSKFDILSEENTKAERAQLTASQIMILTSNSQTGTGLSLSEDLPTSPSDITHVSSCCTLDTESVMSLSNENISDMSSSFCSSQHEQGDATSGPKSQPESKWDLSVGAEDAITASETECEPEKMLNSVFAISSFWSEMEKLTINDILGLRMIGRAAPPSSLSPLQEREEADMFATADSGFFTQMNESKPEQSNEDTSLVPNSVGSSLCSVTTVDSLSSRGVTWESDPVPVSQCADIYPENMTSVTDAFQPVLSKNAQKCLRKISKNVSVHNLHALESESLSYTPKGEALQTLDGETKQIEYFTERDAPQQDKDLNPLPSSLTDSCSISLTDIFQYLFGGNKSVPSQSDTDNLSTFYTDGNSVPETYDHFFSEFDTESFFCPLITAEDKEKDKPVPIFSYSRSANRNLQFPEAYDYFFASSSSGESSAESDEEENCGPVRVVTRLSHKASSPQISTDGYEDFFTDNDLRQNFFWKTTLSFRNINFTASTVQKQSANSLLPLVPVRRSGRSVPPLTVQRNQDVMLPHPLPSHLEERLSKQLAQQAFRHEDLQMTVSNPRLDASFLPLRQSDMCLVCIAFASWVLKTANPQVGDAWKAVLLANVSALSAIRYLRKYVKTEAAPSERKLHHN